MSKHLACLFIFFVLSCHYEKAQNFLDVIFEKTSIEKSQCWEEYIIEQKLNADDTIIFIPEIEKQHKDYLILNSHLFVIDNKTREIKAYFSEKNSLTIDAVKINSIDIIRQPLKLKGSQTIAIKANYSGSSKIYPFSSEELSILVLSENKLFRILKDWPISRINGEIDINGVGEIKEQKRQLKSLERINLENFSLIVSDSTIVAKIENGNKIYLKGGAIDTLKLKVGL